MPKNIIKNIKTINIDGLKCIDPFYLYIEHSKIFNSLFALTVAYSVVNKNLVIRQWTLTHSNFSKTLRNILSKN